MNNLKPWVVEIAKNGNATWHKSTLKQCVGFYWEGQDGCYGAAVMARGPEDAEQKVRQEYRERHGF